MVERDNHIYAISSLTDDRLGSSELYFSGEQQIVMYKGHYVLMGEHEETIRSIQPVSTADLKEKKDFLNVITKLNGYSYIINYHPFYEGFDEMKEKNKPLLSPGVLAQFPDNPDASYPKYESYAICIGKDRKGYYMGFALYYQKRQDATGDLLLIDQMVREKILFTLVGRKLSDLFVMEPKLVFQENNILYGKLYQINREIGLSFWKDTILKRDYFF